MKPYEDENAYLMAKQRVREIKKFYINLLWYSVFILFLAGLNYYVNEWRSPWFLWAALGWGIGLFFQGQKAFNYMSWFGKDWEAKKLKKFMEEENRKSENP